MAMKITSVLLQAKDVQRRGMKSLALSVFFKQPDFGMKDYEILSRASAFLLAVDPPNQQAEGGPYGHLEQNERDRKIRLHRQDHKYTPATGPERDLKDLGWLEFAPQEVRPTVHCVCSSHVLAPFLWKDYYPQDWLNKVKQEHCIYALEVLDSAIPGKVLGKFALNPYPIHHPEGRDLALIHLKHEEESLRLMKSHGVEILQMRDLEKVYEKGDEVKFSGYVVAEANRADSESPNQEPLRDQSKIPTDDNLDPRMFYSYQESGVLAFHTRDRFFATTPDPLPEGLCGGPVLDDEGHVCGVIEGIVPKTHENKDIAGSAAFIPNYAITPFIDFAERFMLQKILPKSLFQKAVTAKTTNSLGGGVYEKDSQGRYQPGSHAAWEEAFDRALDQLKSNHTPEEVEAILNTIQRERKEVMEILDNEGGDLDEVANRVRSRTLQIREMIHDEYRQNVGVTKNK